MSTPYRPEVDGLRAVAVVSVLIYHLDFTLRGYSLLPGGYLGVDVFFVISGYLITAIIARELQETGRFSFARFYERRARRLLPALFAVVAFSLPIGWFVMVPSEFAAMSESILASFFFVSNIHFWGSLQEYGAQSSQLLPFLHTWSLAVEEQFYLIFPIFLILYTRWFGQRWGVFPVLVVAGLIGASVWSHFAPSFSFYWLPSRMWEMLAGSALALAPAFEGPRKEGRDWRMALPALGLVLIGLSVATLELSSLHPGPFTVPTILGTTLIIRYAGHGDPASALLKSRPVVFVGLISYSLYLWHYPLFAFGRLYFVDVTRWHMLALLAASFVFAALSWRFVESPFRNFRAFSTRRTVGVLSSAALCLGAACLAVLVAERSGVSAGLTRLAGAYENNEVDNGLLRDQSWSILNNQAAEQGLGPSHFNDPSVYENERLWFSENPETTKILIIGDSHSKDSYNTLRLNPDKLPNIEVARHALLSLFNQNAIDRVLSSPNFKAADRVFISMSYYKVSIEQLPDLIDQMRSKGKTVVLMSRSPEFKDVGYLPLADYHLRKDADLDVNAFARIAYDARLPIVEEINSLLEKVAIEHNVPLIRKTSLICSDAEQTCDVLLPDGRKAFYDQGHYTLEGAKEFGARMIATYGASLDIPTPTSAASMARSEGL